MAIKSIIEQMEWEEFNRVLDEHVDSTLLEDEEPSKASKQLHLALLSTWEPPNTVYGFASSQHLWVVD